MDIPSPFSLIPKAALKTVGDAAMSVTLGIIMVWGNFPSLPWH